MKNKILKFIQKNWSIISVVIAVAFAGIINIYKILHVFYYNFIFRYYDIDFSFYQFNDNYFFGFAISIVLILGLVCTFYSWIKIREGNLYKARIIDWVIVFLTNILYIYFLTNRLSIINLIILFILICLSELAISFLFTTKQSEENDPFSLMEWIKYLVLLIFWIFIVVLMVAFANSNALSSYRIINESQAIVYSTKDYYIVIDCEIKEDRLILYKGTQQKINTENIYSELKTFKEKDVEYKND